MKERLKKLRKELDLTQKSFGDRIGLKQNTIAQYEMGRTVPSDAILFSICREFNVNEEWLRTGIGDMFVQESNGEIDALVQKYGLSDTDRSLIEKYISLKPQSRDTIIRFINTVSDLLSDDNDFYKDVPDTPEELEAMYPPVDIHKNSDVG